MADPFEVRMRFTNLLSHLSVLSQPTVWFHEVFRQDDTPYRQHEVDLIRQLTGRGTP